jgi:hypothetical protein
VQFQRLLAGVLVALGSLPAKSNAQDTIQTLVGSTRVALDLSYMRPVYSYFRGSGAALPFINDHWQAGLSPTWEVDGGVQHYYLSGGAEAVANYYPVSSGRWLPYVGAFASQRGATFATGNGTYGVQAGYLHFLSPSLAFRSEFRFRHSDVGAASNSEDVLVSLDPYLFGRANRRLTALPAFGIFDVNLFADYTLRPTHSLAVNATLAPFLTRWLQAGSTANMVFAFYRSSGSHVLELFGRGYLPVATRVVPFAELFVGNESLGQSYQTLGSHGTRAGLRTYLTPGVALDLALQWRTYDTETMGPSKSSTSTPPPNRTFRATMTTQFRARRARD